ncbi:DsbA family protein [Natronobeatus ordinarius]|uniref:DsbA family protein n=1 Tax=Natronobeatus ordinarius TaxID=2963433 RepID=UPI0020CED0BB|nr:thioredoxin domain-containing protein [Natronobeatus ordinarius]
MNRRSFLVAVAGIGVSAPLAGCSGSSPDDLADVDADPDQLPTPTLGAGDVTFDVYEDFGCGGCHQFQAQVFPPIESSLIDEDAVTYRHRDFPIPAHERSMAMANAARAVQDETRSGDDPNGAFFEYKSRVFAADDWSDESLAAIAEDVGADPDAVTSALEEGTYYPTLAADWQRGRDDGVGGTPSVVVDGTEVEDAFDLQEITSAVEDAQ